MTFDVVSASVANAALVRTIITTQRDEAAYDSAMRDSGVPVNNPRVPRIRIVVDLLVGQQHFFQVVHIALLCAESRRLMTLPFHADWEKRLKSLVQ